MQIFQPRVARRALPWDTAPEEFNPEMVGSNAEVVVRCRATLGWRIDIPSGWEQESRKTEPSPLLRLTEESRVPGELPHQEVEKPVLSELDVALFCCMAALFL